MIRSSKVLNHARGHACTARFGDICNGDPATSVFCHLNTFGKGMALKTHDILGFIGCSSCHHYYDVQHGTKPLMSDAELTAILFRAVCETWVSLVETGPIMVPLDPKHLSSERPIPARKPPAQRAKVPNNPDRKIQSRNNLRKAERAMP